MKIITGSTGTTHVTSNNDGEFNQGIFGSGFIVLSNGKQLNASIVDNNTIRIEDGDTIFQGRHALIEPNTTEDITIETGTIGMNRNDLIVERYVLDTSTGYESCTLEVVKGDETSGAAVDPELTTGDIRTGSKLAEVALYRVKIEGVTIVALEKLFTVTDPILALVETLNNNLTNTNKDVSALNSNMKDCFQSVSDGKTLVASAITDKGVSTSSDATFETMANNITAIPVGKCISLGNGTSFNVKTVCVNAGIDYTKLTASNFIVGVSQGGASSTTQIYTNGVRHSKATGFTVSKTYNSSTGVLTVSGNTQNVQLLTDGNDSVVTTTQTMTCFAYLVYTG